MNQPMENSTVFHLNFLFYGVFFTIQFHFVPFYQEITRILECQTTYSFSEVRNTGK